MIIVLLLFSLAHGKGSKLTIQATHICLSDQKASPHLKI